MLSASMRGALRPSLVIVAISLGERPIIICRGEKPPRRSSSLLAAQTRAGVSLADVASGAREASSSRAARSGPILPSTRERGQCPSAGAASISMGCDWRQSPNSSASTPPSASTRILPGGPERLEPPLGQNLRHFERPQILRGPLGSAGHVVARGQVRAFVHDDEELVPFPARLVQPVHAVDMDRVSGGSVFRALAVGLAFGRPWFSQMSRLHSQARSPRVPPHVAPASGLGSHRACAGGQRASA